MASRAPVRGRRALVALVFAAVTVLAALACAPRRAAALQFFLHAGQQRCFSEDVSADTRVLGEYVVAAGPGDMRVDLSVTSDDEKTIYSKQHLDHGKFTFQTPASKKHGQRGGGDDHDHDEDEDEDLDWDDEHGDVWETHTYTFCLEGKSGAESAHDSAALRRKVTLNVNSGAAARDYANVAKVEHLDNLEVALRRMEDEVHSILEELEHMRGREEVMRHMNESVSRRVLWYSVVSCLVMVAAGLYQSRYMQSFFRAKKLI